MAPLEYGPDIRKAPGQLFFFVRGSHHHLICQSMCNCLSHSPTLTDLGPRSVPYKYVSQLQDHALALYQQEHIRGPQTLFELQYKQTFPISWKPWSNMTCGDASTSTSDTPGQYTRGGKRNTNAEPQWAQVESQKCSFCSIANGDERGEDTFLAMLAHSEAVSYVYTPLRNNLPVLAS